jgi:hypothetical protein
LDASEYCELDRSSEELSLTLRTNAQKYESGEEVLITATFINNSQENILFNSDLLLNDSVYPLTSPVPTGELGIFIYYFTGERELMGIIGHPRNIPETSDYIILEGGESYSRQYNLSNYGYSLERSGYYIISLVYCNGYDSPSGDKAWKGFLLSNEIQIEITN